MNSQDFVSERLEAAIEEIQAHVNNIRNATWTTLYGFERDRDIVSNKNALMELCHDEIAKLAARDFCFVAKLGSYDGDTARVVCGSKRAATMIAQDTGVRVRIYNTKLIDTEEFLDT